MAQAQRYIADGYDWVVDLDLEKFFDRVNHDKLMGRIAQRVEDRRLLILIRAFLNAGVMENGLVGPSVDGTPQGGPLSPLLSNLVLDDLDRELERRGLRFVRYADDCNIYVRTVRAGHRVMDRVTRFLATRLLLTVNASKSAVARPQERKFLGYGFNHRRIRELTVAPQSTQRLKLKLKQLFRRGRGMKLTDTIERINRITRGWVAYFRLCDVPSCFEALDGWVRRHLRAIQWRQWKTSRTRYQKLRQLGLPPSQARGALNRFGPWRNAVAPFMHSALRNATLARMGLVSLLAESRRLAGTS